MLVHEVALGGAVHSIELLPLSDFHIGSPGFAEDALKKYLRFARVSGNKTIRARAENRCDARGV